LCYKGAEIIGNRQPEVCAVIDTGCNKKISDLLVGTAWIADEEADTNITQCEISRVLAHQALTDVAFTGSTSAIVSTSAGPYCLNQCSCLAGRQSEHAQVLSTATRIRIFKLNKLLFLVDNSNETGLWNTCCCGHRCGHRL